MNRELIPLLIISGLALLGAVIIAVFVPSQRCKVPLLATWEVARNGRFWRQVAFILLCLAVAVCLIFSQNTFVNEVVFRRLQDKTLIEALNDPLEAFSECKFCIVVGCILLMPLCDDRWIGPRSKTPHWQPIGHVFSHARHQLSTRIVTGLGIAVVAYLLLFESLLVGLVSGLFFYIAWMGWSGRKWLEADDIGVNWTGYRFRWEDVASWRVDYTQGSGGYDGTNDSYQLSVVLKDEKVLTREHIHAHQLEGIFSARVPEKREDAEQIKASHT